MLLIDHENRKEFCKDIGGDEMYLIDFEKEQDGQWNFCAYNLEGDLASPMILSADEMRSVINIWECLKMSNKLL